MDDDTNNGKVQGDLMQGDLLSAAQPARIWSTYQRAIFEHVSCGKGHLVVIARAGSGKTSTIIEALNHLPEGKTALMCAFNKSIATTLSNHVPSGVTVKTLHALGYASIKKTWGDHVHPLETRDAAIVDAVVPPKVTFEDRGNLKSLIKFAKAYMVQSDEDLEDLRYQNGLGIAWDYYYDDHGELPGEFGYIQKFSENGEAIDPALIRRAEDAIQFGWVRKALAMSCRRSAEISYADMVYIPAALGIRTGSFDYVFVDELQDMDRGQLMLAQNALRAGGRLVGIGDDRQAIYSFRGADSRAIDRITEELNADVLKLPVSYRCPTSVATMVRDYVPDFETPTGAPEGSIEKVSILKAQETWREGDYVLSRTNAPLVRQCLAALASGTRAFIQGRDIGAGLIALLKKSRAENIPQLHKWLTTWEEAEVKRLTAADKEHLIESARDKAAALTAMTDGLSSISELRTRIEQVFANDGGKKLMFSSVHRAKGMEARRVFVLQPTFFNVRGSRSEEQNLWYVAITRTMEQLYLVQDL
jgi:DNA helicase II / ATP-dependent DNA helicase PcrA